MLTSVDKVIKLIGMIIIGLIFINVVTGGAISQVLRPLFATQSPSSYGSGLASANDEFGGHHFKRTFTFAEIPNLPFYLQFGVLVSLLGVLIYVVSHLVVVVMALLESVPWGIMCFMLPPASFIYALLNFEKCRLALGGMLIGWIFGGLGYAVAVAVM